MERRGKGGGRGNAEQEKREKWGSKLPWLHDNRTQRLYGSVPVQQYPLVRNNNSITESKCWEHLLLTISAI